MADVRHAEPARLNWWRGCQLLACTLTLSSCVWARGATERAAADSSVAEVVTARYPRDASRFELQPLNDSIIVFDPAEMGWVRAGMVGVAVDPARRDALVGQLRVLSVREGRAEALVLGQTTRLAESHVLLLVAPTRAWWKRGEFWWGAAAGALFAVGAAAW